MDPRTVIIRPVVSEKSYALIGEGKYTFRVNDRAHKTQIAHAVEEIFDVGVAAVRGLAGAAEAEAPRPLPGPHAGAGRRRSSSSRRANGSSSSKAQRPRRE